MRPSTLLPLVLLSLFALSLLTPAHATTSTTVENANLVVKNATSLTSQWVVPSPPSTTSSNQAILLYNELGTATTSAQILAVLQWGWYPFSGGGQYWMMYPQYISGYSMNYFNGAQFTVSTGDIIRGTMTQDPVTHYWTITITDVTTGSTSVYNVNVALTMQMVYPSVLQVQSVQKCSDYPVTSPTTFSNIQLYNSSSLIPSPAWNRSILVNDGCGENVVVNSPSSVALYYQTSSPSTYTVTFTESNLPASTSWSVTFNGVTQSSTTSSIAFTNVASGTYSWSTAATISCGAGCQYVASPASGSMSVPTQTSQSIAYTKQYQVTMAANAGGTTSPAVGSNTWVNAGASLSIVATPSSGYSFSSWASSTGSITLASSTSASTTATINAAGTITANFVANPSTYTVTFNEAGLPAGTSWSVTFNGVTQSSTTGTISFANVAAGTYSWSASTPISGGTGIQYAASPASGSLTVSSSITQSISYSTQYYLTVSTSPSGGGTVSPSSGWYSAGASVSLTATANSGYQFGSWTGTGTGSYTGTSNPASVTMNSPVTETASFKPGLTITSGTGGSVTYTYGTTTGSVAAGTSATIYVAAGTSVTLQAVPVAGYSFSGWSGALSGSANPASVSVNGPVSVTGSFSALLYTITFTQSNLPASTSWSVTFSGVTQSSTTSSIAFTNIAGGTYSWSTAATISGGASVQYVASPTSGSMSVPSQTSQSITYTKQYQFTMAATAGGTTSPAAGSTTWVNAGASLSIVATPSSGYSFSSWASSTGSITFASSTSASTTATINAAGTITANFVVVPSTYTVTFTESGLPASTSWSVTFNGVTQSSTTTSIAFANVASGTYSWSTSTPISGGTGVQYVGLPSSGSIAVTSSSSQGVTFSTQYYLTIQTAPSGGGTVSSTSSWYGAGAAVQLTASANAGYALGSWTGTGTGSYSGGASPATVTMNGPVSETANFYPGLTISSGTGGSVTYSYGSASGSIPSAASQTVFVSAGTTVTLQAVPGAGYLFGGWGGAITGSSNPASITVNLPQSVSASFVVALYSVTFMETGLPPGASWTATFNGVASSSTTSNIVYGSIASGTYSWSVSPLTVGNCNYAATPASGSLVVPSQTSQSITFVASCTVVFSETGLPSGTTWAVAYNGITLSSATNMITFTSVPAGAHSYSIGPVSSAPCSYNANPASGSADPTVVGSLSTAFTPSCTVTFTESGLISGTQWSVTFNGVTSSSTTSVIGFSGVGSGSYSWSAQAAISCGSGCQYSTQQSSGSISVPTQTSQAIPYALQYQISMVSNPSSGGTTTPPSGSASWVNAGGSLSLAATTSSGYMFSAWSSSTVSITLTTPSSTTTTATVNGPGTITSNFMATVALGLSSTTASVTLGGSTTITATVSGGAQSVTLTWSSLPAGVTLTIATNPTTDSPSGVQDVITVAASPTAAQGAFSVTLTATGSNGQTSSTSFQLTVSDTTAPSVAITSPLNGAFVTSAISVTVSASDNVAVTKTEIYVDGTLVTTSSSSSLTYTWDTTPYTNAQHTLLAKAYDAAGNAGTSSAVTVTVDNNSPSVAIVSPANGAVISGSVTVSVAASDDTAILKVELYVDGTLYSVDTVSPYDFTLNTALLSDGTHTLVAKAYDSANVMGASAAVSVSVNNSILLSYTAVQSGSYLSITALASAPSGIRQVQFIIDGKVKATDSSAPYTYNWSLRSAKNGLHTITIKAFDNAGNVAQVSFVVTVQNRAII